jgi:hypothetical protein
MLHVNGVFTIECAVLKACCATGSFRSPGLRLSEPLTLNSSFSSPSPWNAAPFVSPAANGVPTIQCVVLIAICGRVLQ